MAISWVAINRGDPIPNSAIKVGSTEADGELWVGRYQGEAGKINVKDGTFWNFWGRDSGGQQSAEILVSMRNCKWQTISRGDVMPIMAVKAGETKGDGATYVAQYQGETGKVNTDGGKMWNFWGNNTGGHEEAQLLVFEAAYWEYISTGDTVPDNAVKAGSTSRDGDLWVGRANDEAGKINVENGKMYNFWGHSSGKSSTAEILCCDAAAFAAGRLRQEWMSIQRGEPIPPNALKACENAKDGAMYVGRHEGEAGKINCEGGNMHNWWGRDLGDKKHAEILCIFED